jgi:aldose 1-epimerase
MGIQIRHFGETANISVPLVTMSNVHGMEVGVSSYGATLVSLVAPDRNGTLADVALGYDDVADYVRNEGYFGATIGRNGNRTGGAKITINGKEYALEANDGENNLHSGPAGMDKRIWKMEISEKDLSVTFSCRSPDKDQGFPGNMDVSVTYTLTDENELQISYTGKTDADTIANLTNHSYFNLAGHGSGKIHGHYLWLNAEAFTPINEKRIPCGEIRGLAGTAFDFRTPRPIGENIEKEEEQLILAGGYDHNFVLNEQNGKIRRIAEVFEPSSGRVLEVYTDCVGVQFYSGNSIKNTPIGKAGVVYGHRSGFCLETQFYPDANHHAHFPSPILKAGETYKTVTLYKFSAR